MIPIGVNVDPVNAGGGPDPAILRALGLSSIRIVLRPSVRPYLDACRAAGLSALGVLTGQSGSPYRYTGWGLPLVEVGNEMDLAGPASWPTSPEAFAVLWLDCREAFPGVQLLIGGMASGQVALAAPYVAIAEGAAALAVHLYAETAEEARATLHAYRERFGLPRLVTEWNRPAGEIGDFLRMLSEETAGAWWYAAVDAMNPGFGLFDHPDKLQAMTEAIMDITELDPLVQRIALLEKQGSDRDNVLKQVLQGQWTGFPSAEASLKALMGGDANPDNATWSAVPFPVGQ